jgi:O-antigen/teichoic acid export membrane protein
VTPIGSTHSESRSVDRRGTASHSAEFAHSSGHLLRGAYSLLANTAVTSVLGMGFWVAAARLYSRVEVGRDTVLISVMIELSTICQMNMGNGIVRFLPDLGARSGRALGVVYLLTGAIALLAGSAFVLVAPGLSHELAFLGEETTLAVGFVAALALWGLFTLQDAALMATRRAPWIPVENGLFGALKLGALPILLAVGAVNGVFVAWALPMALLLVPVNLLVFRRAIPVHVAGEARESSVVRLGRRRVVRFLAQDYLASVFTQATLTVLPLLVIAILGARESAYFAMPFTIALAFDTFAYSACTSLVVEATLERERLRALTKVFVRRVLTLLMPAAALLALAAPLVMLPFGHAYAEHGAGVLRLLLCASVLRVVIALFSAVARAQGRGWRLASVELALLVLVLGSAVPLAHAHGIEGVGASWLMANALICVAVLPQLIGFLRGSEASGAIRGSGEHGGAREERQ